MTDIIGHNSIRSFFERAIERDTLSHAYAFFGPRHVGKRTVAEDIARKILGITGASFAHPDLSVVERDVDEKTGFQKKDVSVSQIRELIQHFSQSAFVHHGYRVALIHDVEYLNPSGSNALLKTLEEPRGRTVIFLIAENEHALLPTIRSRVQSIYFSPVPDSEIQESVARLPFFSEVGDSMIHDAHGLPGLLTTWVSDLSTYQGYLEEKERCVSLISRPFHEKIARIEHLFEQGDDHIKARALIVDTLRLWTLAFRDVLLDRATLAHRSSIPRILDALRIAEGQLARNIHPRLVLEHVLLAIP